MDQEEEDWDSPIQDDNDNYRDRSNGNSSKTHSDSTPVDNTDSSKRKLCPSPKIPNKLVKEDTSQSKTSRNATKPKTSAKPLQLSRKGPSTNGSKDTDKKNSSQGSKNNEKDSRNSDSVSRMKRSGSPITTKTSASGTARNPSKSRAVEKQVSGTRKKFWNPPRTHRYTEAASSKRSRCGSPNTHRPRSQRTSPSLDRITNARNNRNRSPITIESRGRTRTKSPKYPNSPERAAKRMRSKSPENLETLNCNRARQRSKSPRNHMVKCETRGRRSFRSKPPSATGGSRPSRIDRYKSPIPRTIRSPGSSTRRTTRCSPEATRNTRSRSPRRRTSDRDIRIRRERSRSPRNTRNPNTFQKKRTRHRASRKSSPRPPSTTSEKSNHKYGRSRDNKETRSTRNPHPDPEIINRSRTRQETESRSTSSRRYNQRQRSRSKSKSGYSSRRIVVEEECSSTPRRIVIEEEYSKMPIRIVVEEESSSTSRIDSSIHTWNENLDEDWESNSSEGPEDLRAHLNRKRSLHSPPEKQFTEKRITPFYNSELENWEAAPYQNASLEDKTRPTGSLAAGNFCITVSNDLIVPKPRKDHEDGKNSDLQLYKRTIDNTADSGYSGFVPVPTSFTQDKDCKSVLNKDENNLVDSFPPSKSTSSPIGLIGKEFESWDAAVKALEIESVYGIGNGRCIQSKLSPNPMDLLDSLTISGRRPLSKSKSPSPGFPFNFSKNSQSSSSSSRASTSSASSISRSKSPPSICPEVLSQLPPEVRQFYLDYNNSKHYRGGRSPTPPNLKYMDRRVPDDSFDNRRYSIESSIGGDRQWNMIPGDVQSTNNPISSSSTTRLPKMTEMNYPTINNIKPFSSASSSSSIPGVPVAVTETDKFVIFDYGA